MIEQEKGEQDKKKAERNKTKQGIHVYEA